MKPALLMVIILWFACKPPTPEKTYNDNKIKFIETSEQVLELLKSIDSNKFRNYSIEDTLKYRDKLSKRIYDSLGLKLWYKADFDGNGYLDLLINASDGYSLQKIVCVLDSGNNTFKPLLVKVILGAPWDRFVFPYVAELNNKSALIVKRYNNNINFSHYSAHFTDLITDTLVYEYENFIEFNANPAEENISKIDIVTSSCEGTCPIFSLGIDRHDATYNATMFNRDTGKFRAVTNLKDFDRFASILNYCNFKKLDSTYAVGWTDAPGAVLTVHYNDNQIKRIKDYGQQGNYGLMAIYSELFAFRDNQKWEKIKK
ncbi:MAG TPA: DUF6438 domain-containing protein [Bacteroidia bacterium]|nr:DUF6438 domain-containing protein [Bacteroidia bacterium]